MLPKGRVEGQVKFMGRASKVKIKVTELQWLGSPEWGSRDWSMDFVLLKTLSIEEVKQRG
jgi:hypothetical protein